MATAVRESRRPVAGPAQPDPHWDWRVAPRHGDTHAVTARAAWEQRVAWRLDNPEAWRAELAQLAYFDPAYTYDEAHEYQEEGTTDPHLSVDLRHWILDEDGFASPQHYRHTPLLVAMLFVLRAMFGNRVEREPEVHFDPDFGSRAGMYTEKGHPVSQVEPDLVVLPQELLLPEDAERSRDGRTMRLDQGHPVPELVMEILSPTTRTKDVRGKLRLYADLGIAEYLTCDPGGEPEPDVPAALQFFRLQPDGRYRQDEDAPAYFSTVCDTHVRLWQPDTRRPPRFQWLDAKQNRWRDREADAEFELREREAIGEARGRTEATIDTIHALLNGVLPQARRDRIAEAWHRHGLPDDAVARLLAVRDAPATWHDLLEPDPDTRTDRDDQPPPRDW
ncbi:MAG: Uma2 family endonuclease [Caldilineaceae bacterium]|nr:Uma2 family endonuclease [Caldilineaceae bacterium]